jgi:tryptophanyl-tRNA synthetase
MSIYASVTGKNLDDIRQEFEGKGYGDFKAAVGEAVAETLRPIQESYNELMAARDYLQDIMKKGAEDANRIARRTLGKVYRKIGLQ